MTTADNLSDLQSIRVDVRTALNSLLKLYDRTEGDHLYAAIRKLEDAAADLWLAECAVIDGGATQAMREVRKDRRAYLEKVL